jgi:hypothetical protein
MPLTPREAFKTGFLIRCEEEGLGADEITARTKAAHVLHHRCANATPEEEQLVKQAFGPLQAGANLAGSVLNLLVKAPWLALGGGAIAGAGGGMLAGKLRNEFDPVMGAQGESTPEEIQDIQAAELVQSLSREAASTRRRAGMLKLKRKREEEDANRWSRI